MPLWGRTLHHAVAAGPTVAHAAAANASREELVRAALLNLASQVRADRLGVWFAEAAGDGSFRGILWDTQEDLGETKGSRLSQEIASFLRPLEAGDSKAESALDISPHAPIIGPLLDMHRALWIPVMRGGHRQGLLMAASHRRDAVFSRPAMEGIAEELSLALVLEQERRKALDGQSDLSLLRDWIHSSGGGVPPENILSRVVEDCTAVLGAEFAAIGRLTHPAAPPEFLWRSGDPQLQSCLESAPVKSLCGRTLEEGCICSAEDSSVASGGGSVQFVALPLAHAGERLGVLVANFRSAESTPAALQRLELRAALASEALAQRNAIERKAQRSARTAALLRKHSDPLLLLDAGGRLLSQSQGAGLLLGTAATKDNAALFDLFHRADRGEVAQWWKTVAARPESRVSGHSAMLLSGVPIRLHLPIPVGDDVFAVAFEETASKASSASGGSTEVELRTLLEWL